MKLLAFLTNNFQHIQNGFVLAACQPGGGANANTFNQKFDDLNNFFMFGSHPFERLRFAVCFCASHTAIALNDAISVLKSAKFDRFPRVDSWQNVTEGWGRQPVVASRLRLPRTVKKFLSFCSMFFFKAKGSNWACVVRSLALVASGISGLASSR